VRVDTNYADQATKSASPPLKVFVLKNKTQNLKKVMDCVHNFKQLRVLNNNNTAIFTSGQALRSIPVQ